MKTFTIEFRGPFLEHPGNSFSLSGDGAITIDSQDVLFLQEGSPPRCEEFGLADIANVQREGNRLRIETPGGDPTPYITFWAADERDAESLESLLTERDRLTVLPLEFQGEALEYFRIWIVNLCLTLLTLGIFSAWAKVRNKRYLYSHTVLAGTPFQYLGQPLPILRGRLIAVVLFLTYFISRNLVTSALPFVCAAGLVLAPWVLVRSAAFNARYSAYRNMTLSFDGNYVEAAKTLYWLGLIPILAVGGAFDWGGHPVLDKIAFNVFGFCFPWWLARLKTFVIGHTRFGGVSGQLTIRGGQLWGIYFLGGLQLVGAAVVGLMILASASSLSTLGAVVLALPVFLAGYAFSHGYIQARSGNAVWNNTRLGTLRFESMLRAGELAWLYFGNAVAIIGSAGLLTPWAVVRTIKYRTSKLRVLIDGDLAAFEGSKTDSVEAAGAEIGQIFDFDLSL